MCKFNETFSFYKIKHQLFSDIKLKSAVKEKKEVRKTI